MQYDGYDVYKQYVALKNHFHGNFDYFKYNGQIKTNYGAYERRRDKVFFQNIARKVNEKEIVPFLVANFMADDNMWIGDMVHDYDRSHNVYLEWKKKIFSLYRVYEQDLDLLIEFISDRQLDIKDIFAYNDADHPLIFRFVLQGMIEVETFILLDNLMHFTEKYNEKLSDDIIWNNKIGRINKYRLFIQYDREKVRKLTENKFKPLI